MKTVRPAGERGHFDFGWLHTWHTFSFGEYYDPSWMGFRSLRVINDDRIAGGGAFGTHPHHDMEILTWVLEGAVRHEDSMGNEGLIRPGEAQRMSAGTGVRHSEANASPSEWLRLLQVWILPERAGLPPSYEQAAFPESVRRGRACLIASRDGRDGSVVVHQDVSVYASLLRQGEGFEHELAEGRHAWLQVATGRVVAGGEGLRAGDGLAVSDERKLEVVAGSDAEVLLFDLA